MDEINSAELTLLEIFRTYQLKNRFISTPFGFDVSLVGSHILLDLEQEPLLRGKDLADRLSLDRSSISRALSKLSDQRYVVARVGESDRREGRWELTGAGRHLVLELHRNVEERQHFFGKNVTSPELIEFTSLLKRFADASNAKPILRSTESSGVAVEIRRLTRLHGVLGNSYLGTSYSSSQWQLLTEISRSGGTITLTALSEKLNIALNTTSLTVDSLSKKRLISKSSHHGDKRIKLLSLTEPGEGALQSIHDAAEVQFGTALHHFSTKERSRLIQLFAQFVGITLQADGTHNRLDARIVSEERDRATLRASYLQHMVRQNLHFFLPGEIASSSNLVMELLIDGSQAGIAEFKKSSSKNWELMNFSMLVAPLGPATQTASLLHIARTKLPHTGGAAASVFVERASKHLSVVTSLIDSKILKGYATRPR